MYIYIFFTNLILMKIDINLRYTMMHVFFKITIGSCKFMQLTTFANKFVCTVLTDVLTRCC